MGEMTQQAQVRMDSLIRAFITQSYLRLVSGEDDEANAYMQRAQEMWNAYARKVQGSEERLRLTPLPEMKKEVLQELLNPKSGLSPEAQARLRTQLGLPAPSSSPTPPPEANK